MLLLLLLLSPLVVAMPQGLVALADTNTLVMMVRNRTITPGKNVKHGHVIASFHYVMAP